MPDLKLAPTREPRPALPAEPLAQRLTRLHPPAEGAMPALSRTLTYRLVPARTQLLGDGEGMSMPWAIIGGWACHMRQLWDGRRQILGILVPGELFGRSRTEGGLSSTTIMALTPIKLATSELLRESDVALRDGQTREVAVALRKSDALHEAYLLNQITRLGRQTAYERTAHFLLELRDRLKLAGVVSGNRFDLPLTQETLADLLGLTAVHMNRTLQQLRRDALIETRNGQMCLVDMPALSRVSEYVAPRVSAR